VRSRFFDSLDFFEGKLFRIFPLLRDDKRFDPLQRGDLPVDVKHLGLEEGRAVKRDDRSGFRRVVQCLRVNSP
jgi:hypothetical protein